MTVIDVQNLYVKYQNKSKETVTALTDVSLSFRAGAFNCVLGESGSGKTTLIRAVAGLTDYEGTILFDGVDASSVLIKDRFISFVSQNFVLYGTMTVFDNIAFPLKMMGTPVDEITQRVKKVASLLDVEVCLTRKPKHLSIGQQQRVAIARAIVKRPSVCLLDEPFSNLDAVNKDKIGVMLKKIQLSLGATFIAVTHDVRQAMALADYMFVLNGGRLVGEGTPLQLYDDEQNRYVFDYLRNR